MLDLKRIANMYGVRKSNLCQSQEVINCTTRKVKYDELFGAFG